IRSPYGAFPGYISLIAADFNLANEKAWEIGASHDWGGTTVPALRVPGLWTTLLYAEGFSIKPQAQNVSVGTRREADVSTIYRPSKLPGFQFRFLASMVRQEPQSRLFYDFRIIMDYELPLLGTLSSQSFGWRTSMDIKVDTTSPEKLRTGVLVLGVFADG